MIALLATNEITDDELKLFCACQEGDIAAYDKLIQKGVNPNVLDGVTKNRPIHVAVNNGAVEIVKRMLDDQRVDPTVAGQGWFQPIEIAEIRNYKMIKKLFEEHGIVRLEIPRLPDKRGGRSNDEISLG